MTKVKDITFIGSGISSSFTMLHLLDRIEEKPFGRTLYIAVFDRYKEFHTGIPYGNRSGYSVLLITSLKNFLPEPELGRFLPWLNANKERLLNEFLKEGGSLSKKWIEKHALKLENNEWEDLFIPRRFFGEYINEKIGKKIEKLTAIGYIDVKYFQGEVTDVSKYNDDFKIDLDKNVALVSKKVVLSVGSLPVKTLWKDKSLIEEQNLLFINNPYKPELKSVLNQVKRFVKNRRGKQTNAMIIGANASGLELLYKLNDDKSIGDSINNFTVLSTQGLLPDSVIDHEKQKLFTPKHLNKLVNQENLTASKIAEATYKDLDLADNIPLGAASTVGIISKAFGSLRYWT